MFVLLKNVLYLSVVKKLIIYQKKINYEKNFYPYSKSVYDFRSICSAILGLVAMVNHT